VVPALAALLPFCRDSPQYEAHQLAAFLATVACTPLGSLETTHYALRERLATHHVRVPHAATLRSNMPLHPSFQQELAGTYNEAELNQATDIVFHSQVEAGRRLGFIKGARSIAVLDGKPTPYYGRSYVYGNRPRRATKDMVPAARLAHPAFRAHKRSVGKVPYYRGTVNALEFVQLTQYDLETQWNGTLGVRRVRKDGSLWASEAELLADLEDAPAVLLHDREAGNEPATRVLRQYCAKYGGHVMVALPQLGKLRTLVPGAQVSLRAEIAGLWADRDACHPIAASDGQFSFWAMARRRWLSVGDHDHNVLVLYRTRPPKDESEDIPDSGLVLEVGDQRLPVYAMPFYVTFDEEFMHQNAASMDRFFSLRWSGENVNKRLERHGARSPSRGMFMRHFTHAASLMMANNWGLWRCHRERARRLRRWHPATSFQVYLDGLREDLLGLTWRPRVR
ncbi:MAG: hypothetical protein ABR586_08455, partial [Thermoplasmatota archaeon]